MIAREYGWPRETILRLPIAEALCYQAEILQHNEVDTGNPNFAERDVLKYLRV